MGRAVIWGSLLSAILFASAAIGQSRLQQPPDQLVRQVIAHEVQAEEHDNSYWMFQPDRRGHLADAAQPPLNDSLAMVA
jgi:hypothetical protein